MRLVTRAVAEGLEMTVLPGPSAVITALVAAGLEGDGFRFVGYLPRRAAGNSRRRWRAGAAAAGSWSPSRPASGCPAASPCLPPRARAAGGGLSRADQAARGDRARHAARAELAVPGEQPGRDAACGGRARRDHPGDRRSGRRRTRRRGAAAQAGAAAAALLGARAVEARRRRRAAGLSGRLASRSRAHGARRGRLRRRCLLQSGGSGTSARRRRGPRRSQGRWTWTCSPR